KPGKEQPHRAETARQQLTAGEIAETASRNRGCRDQPRHFIGEAKPLRKIHRKKTEHRKVGRRHRPEQSGQRPWARRDRGIEHIAQDRPKSLRPRRWWQWTEG